MAQFINGLQVKSVTYFDKLGRTYCTVTYTDNTYENMSTGDFGRNVKRVADEGEVTRLEVDKSEGYENALKKGYVGLVAGGKQCGLGRWK